MPAPNKNILTKQAQTNFFSKRIQVPTEWAGAEDQFNDAFAENEKSVLPNSPTNLFREPTLNKYHVDSAKEIGELFAAYIEGICSAICDGIDKWMKMASIAAVSINGPIGMLLPGCVIGPLLKPLIISTAPTKTDQEKKYSNAIANTISTSWQTWHMGLTGVLNYPAFIAFPGPVAPPMPNVPMPIIAFSSPGETALSPANMKLMMKTNLADPTALHSDDLFDAISKAFFTIFQIFKTSTLIQNVLGTGPIPTFAPPFVPVGPVVSGTVLPCPGVFV